MKIIETPLEGVLLLEPRVFGDARGFFLECFHAERYAAAGIPECVQDNLSRSSRGVLRGLHYQLIQPQGKLVQVIRGEIWDVVVDVRRGSPTWGQWFGAILSDENHLQIYIPPGFAHGFCVLSESVDLHYKCTDYYHPASEVSVRWNDPNLGISWPIEHPRLSEKDGNAPLLSELPADRLPEYR